MEKYKVGIFICFLFCIMSVQWIYAKVNHFELLGKVIYLDPGHGGIG